MAYTLAEQQPLHHHLSLSSFHAPPHAPFRNSANLVPYIGAPSMAPRPRKPQIGHFDPDELTRRLYLVLAERRDHERYQAERFKRRATRPLPAPLTSNSSSYPQQQKQQQQSFDDSPAGEYHHIPSQAAKQFTRTTTVHQRHLTLHMSGRNARTPDFTLPQQPQQRRRSTFHPFFQPRRTGSDAPPLATTRNRHQSYAEGSQPNDSWRSRTRSSTDEAEPPRAIEETRGSISEETTTPSPPAEPAQMFAADAHEHRVDWTQSDEVGVGGREKRPKLLLSPFLKKADSLLGLRGKGKGGKGMEGGDNKEESTSPTSKKTPKSPKSPKERFFAKFIR